MLIKKLDEKLDDAVDFYGFSKRYNSPYIKGIHGNQLDKIVKEHPCDEDKERVSSYFNFNKLAQLTIGLA
jgi:hypothetical protein